MEGKIRGHEIGLGSQPVLEPRKNDGRGCQIFEGPRITLLELFGGHVFGPENHMIHVIKRPVLVQYPVFHGKFVEELGPGKGSHDIYAWKLNTGLLNKGDRFPEHLSCIMVKAKNKRALDTDSMGMYACDRLPEGSLPSVSPVLDQTPRVME